MTGSLERRLNPYVGPRAFEEGDQEYFYGRDEEIAILAGLVMARRSALLYAQSGAGKSSLLKAGLIPRLTQSNATRRARLKLRVLPVLSVSGSARTETQNTAANIFVFNALSSLSPDADPATLALQTLSEGLQTYFEVAETTEGQPSLPSEEIDALLIFDQFEELFTHHAERWQEREGFFIQVREALESYPGLHVLFSMREDYIAELSPYAHLLPEQLRSRFRLERLKFEAALAAVEAPAKRVGREFAEGVAAELVKNLLRAQPGRKAGESATLGQYVEPVHLQIVCRDMWQKLEARSQQDTVIEIDDLQVVDVDQALIGFYEATLTTVVAETDISQRRLRTWFDKQLVTSARTRRLVYRDERVTEGLPNAAVEILNDAYLIRASIRGGDTYYELVHDRLVEPILSANQAWQAGYANPLAAPTQAWLTEGRSKARLLSRAALEEARQYAAQNPGELEPEEREFLKESLNAQRQARLLRSAVVFIFLILAALTTWALVQRSEAQRNAKIATSREKAAQAIAQIELDPETSVRLALEAQESYYTREAEKALHQALYTLRLDHKTSLRLEGRSLAFSPDGARLALGNMQGYIDILAWENEQLQSVLKILPSDSDEPSGVLDLAFNATGTQLASAHEDGTVRVWKVATGKELGTLPREHFNNLTTSVAFTQDDQLVTGNLDGKAKLWESQDGGAYKFTRFFLHPDGVTDLALDPDGATLITAGRQGDIRFWDIASGDLLQSLEGHTGEAGTPILIPETGGAGVPALPLAYGGIPTDEVTSLAISPYGWRMASGSRDKTIMLWDLSVEPAEIIATLYDHTNTITDLGFSPNGRCLASASLDRSVKIWEAYTGKFLLNLPGHTAGVYAIEFNPLETETSLAPTEFCGWTLATLSGDGELRLWNLGATYEKSTFTGHAGPVESAIFSPDGSRIATGSDDGTARVWEAASGKELMILEGHASRINRLTFSPDGRWLATASWDGTARLWSAQTGKPSRPLEHANKVESLAFSPDSILLATAGDDGFVKLWEVANGKLLNSLELDGIVYGVTFSPDGTQLVASGQNGVVIVWDAATYEPTATLEHGTGEVYDAAFSPDGSRFATVSWDGSVWIWDASSGEQIGKPMFHTDRVYGVKFSLDGEHLFTSSADGTVQMWDVNTGESARTFPGPEFNSLDISRDGKTLVVGGEDGTTRLYFIDFEALLEAAIARLEAIP